MKELPEIISDQQAAGFSSREIVKNLVQLGYNESEVKNYLKSQVEAELKSNSKKIILTALVWIVSLVVLMLFFPTYDGSWIRTDALIAAVFINVFLSRIIWNSK